MSLVLKLYLIDLVCSLPVLLLIAGMLFLCAFLVSSDERKTSRHFKKGVVLIVLYAVSECFTPSKKEAYLYFGIYEVEQYLNSNDKAKEIPQLVIDALHKCLSEEANQ